MNGMKMKFISILSEWVIAVAMSSFIFILLIKESELNYFISGNEMQWSGEGRNVVNLIARHHSINYRKLNLIMNGAELTPERND